MYKKCSPYLHALKIADWNRDDPISPDILRHLASWNLYIHYQLGICNYAMRNNMEDIHRLYLKKIKETYHKKPFQTTYNRTYEISRARNMQLFEFLRSVNAVREMSQITTIALKTNNLKLFTRFFDKNKKYEPHEIIDMINNDWVSVLEQIEKYQLYNYCRDINQPSQCDDIKIPGIEMAKLLLKSGNRYETFLGRRVIHYIVENGTDKQLFSLCAKIGYVRYTDANFLLKLAIASRNIVMTKAITEFSGNRLSNNLIKYFIKLNDLASIKFCHEHVGLSQSQLKRAHFLACGRPPNAIEEYVKQFLKK